MITFVFLMFVGMFAIAGVFISLEAKRRTHGHAARPPIPRNNTPKIGRATTDGD